MVNMVPELAFDWCAIKENAPEENLILTPHKRHDLPVIGVVVFAGAGAYYSGVFEPNPWKAGDIVRCMPNPGAEEAWPGLGLLRMVRAKDIYCSFRDATDDERANLEQLEQAAATSVSYGSHRA